MDTDVVKTPRRIATTTNLAERVNILFSLVRGTSREVEGDRVEERKR